MSPTAGIKGVLVHAICVESETEYDEHADLTDGVFSHGRFVPFVRPSSFRKGEQATQTKSDSSADGEINQSTNPLRLEHH